MANEAKKKILIYLLLAFALSAVFYWLILVGAKGKSGELLIFGLMWCPGVAALATRLAARHGSLLYRRRLCLLAPPWGAAATGTPSGRR